MIHETPHLKCKGGLIVLFNYFRMAYSHMTQILSISPSQLYKYKML
jgi:hypothetical protein